MKIYYWLFGLVFAIGFFSCSEEDDKELESISVNGIIITRYPNLMPSNAPWDVVSTPDIYPVLRDADSTVLYRALTMVENVKGQGAYAFQVSPAVIISAINTDHELQVYDRDDESGGDADDFMGGVIFKPRSIDPSLPDTISIDAGGGVAFKLAVEYTYQ